MDDPAMPDFDAWWDYDDPAATERRFRELLPRAEQQGSADYLAQLLTQIARAQGLQREFAAAHATLDRADALAAPELVVARVRSLLERGRALNSAGEPERAAPLFQAALELAQAHAADGYAVDAAHMLAIVAPAEQQLAANLRALALAERSRQPAGRRWRASLLNNLGWSYHALGQHERALEHFERALAAREEAGAVGPIRVARWCVGRGLRALGRHAEALALQRALLAEHEQAGSADGYVHEELAENLLALGQTDAAREQFAAAYAQLVGDSWLAEREPERLARLRALAGIDRA